MTPFVSNLICVPGLKILYYILLFFSKVYTDEKWGMGEDAPAYDPMEKINSDFNLYFNVQCVSQSKRKELM